MVIVATTEIINRINGMDVKFRIDPSDSYRSKSKTFYRVEMAGSGIHRFFVEKKEAEQMIRKSKIKPCIFNQK